MHGIKDLSVSAKTFVRMCKYFSEKAKFVAIPGDILAGTSISTWRVNFISID